MDRMTYKTRAVRTLSLLILVALLAALGPPTLTDSAALAQDDTPAPPVLTSSADTGNQVDLSWNAVTGADDYELWRWETAEGWSQVGGEITGTTYTDTSVEAGKTYYYQVSADGGATWSNRVSETVGSLDAPTLNASPPTSSMISLSWTAVTGAASYALWRFDTSWAQVGGAITATAYDDTDVAIGTTYYYQLRAISGSSEGAWSNRVTVTVPSTTPGAPQNLTATAGGGQVMLAWNPPADNGGSIITEYQYRYQMSGGEWMEEWTSTGMDRTATVSGLNLDTQYNFEVRAVNANGDGAAASASATTTATPGMPQNLSATAGDSQVTLSWGAPTENGGSAITGYAYRYQMSGGEWMNWVEVALNQTATVSGLDVATQYNFEVRASNANGDGAAASTSATTTATPGMPQNPSATAGDSQVTLSWGAPTENGGSAITGYAYRYQMSGGEWMNWVEVALNQTATVSGLDVATQYNFEVRASNANGDGAAASASATTTATPGMPQNFMATPGDAEVTLTWDAPESDGGSAITGYAFRYQMSGGEWMEWTPTGMTRTVTVTGLTNDTAHDFEVRASNANGDGNEVATATATPMSTVPAVPTGFGVTSTALTSITLGWPAVPGATGYEIQRRMSGDTDWTDLTGVSGMSHTDSGLTPATSYNYQIRATNVAGESGWSAMVTVSTDTPVAPDAPALTASPTSANTIRLTWSAPNNGGSAITVYRIDVSDDGSDGSWSMLASPAAAATSYDHDGLARLTEKHYRIRASNAYGDSAWSVAVSATTRAEAPRIPTSLVASATSDTMITISWIAPDDNGGSDITRYELQVSNNGSTGWSALGGSLTTPAYEHSSGLTAGTTKYYKVRAYNVAGAGAWSLVTSATTTGAVPKETDSDGGPTAPDLLTMVATTDTSTIPPTTPTTAIKITWGAATDTNYNDADTFRLERWDASANSWKRIGNDTNGDSRITDADTSLTVVDGYTDLGLKPNAAYYYRVQAKHETEDKWGSWDYEPGMTEAGRPSDPDLTAEATGPKTIKLKWTPPADNGGKEVFAYYLQYSSDDGTTWESLGGTTKMVDVDNDATSDEVEATEVSSIESSYTHSGDDLMPGMVYDYRIFARNDEGFSGTTGTPGTMATEEDVMTKTSVPGAPKWPLTAAGALDTTTAGTIVATWVEPDSIGGSTVTIDNYQLERWHKGDADWEPVDCDGTTDGVQPCGAVLTHSDMNGIAGGTQYSYRVRASNTDSEDYGPWSEVRSVTTPSGSPGKPSLLAVPIGPMKVQLRWVPPTNDGGSAIDEYQIYFHEDGTSPPATGLGPGDDLAADPSADPTADPVVPPTYGILDKLGGTKRVADAEDFGDSVPTMLKPGTAYHFYIRAVHKASASADDVRGEWSDPAIVTTPPNKPDRPLLRATGPTANSIQLTWGSVDADGDGVFDGDTTDNDEDPNTDISGDDSDIDGNGSPISSFELRRWDGSQWIVVDADLPAQPQLYINRGLASGKTYYYSIRAKNGAGYSKWSLVADAKTTAGKPEAPVLTATPMAGKIQLTWTKPHNGGSSITEYELQSAELCCSADNWTDVDFDPAGTMPSDAMSAQFLESRMYDHSVDAGQTMYYRIRAMNASGNSSWSQIVNATTPAGKPAAPVLTAVKDGATTIRLTWPKPKDGGSPITGYKIEEWDRSSAMWNVLANLGPGATSYPHAVEPGSTHYYRISAMNDVDSGPPSNVAYATTDAATPGAPLDLTRTVMGDKVRLTWKAPNDGGSPITEYQLEYRMVVNRTPGLWMEVARSTSVAPTHTASEHALGSGKMAEYRVRAMNGSGYGPWSGIVSATTAAKAPARPTLMAEAGTRAILLEWTEPANNGSAITAYKIQYWDRIAKEWKLLTTRPGADLNHTHRVASGTRHFYRLIAVNAIGDSPPSTITTVKAN